MPVNNKQAPTIETGRLILRAKTVKEASEVHAYFNDDEVRMYLGGYPPTELNSIVGHIKRSRSNSSWSVVLKETGKVIGECDIHNIVDRYLGHVGYIMDRSYWGKGYMFEAMNEVVRHGFEVMNLGRLRADIDCMNLRSINLIKRLVFSLETTMEEVDFGGRVANVAYFSLKKSGLNNNLGGVENDK